MQLLEGPAEAPDSDHEVPVQVDSDQTLIALWLAGKADRTIRTYRDDVAAFLRFVDKPLREHPETWQVEANAIHSGRFIRGRSDRRCTRIRYRQPQLRLIFAVWQTCPSRVWTCK